jgi:alkanesulfonate monooxygenase SsuD/methylene tetrahydromethanopterin reductase-like flavin-dependent oxidoreductase (luciferase family)
VHLAKEAATLQELSGVHLKLGLGMGWHEDEFRFLGVQAVATHATVRRFRTVSGRPGETRAGW